MLSEKTYKIWRITNLGLIFIGLIAPWVDITVDRPPAIIYGWEFFYWAIRIFIFGVPTYLEYGLIDIVIFNFFIGLTGIFLMYYLLYNTYAVINLSRRNKIVGEILVVLRVVIVFSATFGGRERMLPGLYLCAIGVASAALLEWQPK